MKKLILLILLCTFIAKPVKRVEWVFLSLHKLVTFLNMHYTQFDREIKMYGFTYDGTSSRRSQRSYHYHRPFKYGKLETVDYINFTIGYGNMSDHTDTIHNSYRIYYSSSRNLVDFYMKDISSEGFKQCSCDHMFGHLYTSGYCYSNKQYEVILFNKSLFNGKGIYAIEIGKNGKQNN
jgi:hypothetical protein